VTTALLFAACGRPSADLSDSVTEPDQPSEAAVLPTAVAAGMERALSTNPEVVPSWEESSINREATVIPKLTPGTGSVLSNAKIVMVSWTAPGKTFTPGIAETMPIFYAKYATSHQLDWLGPEYTKLATSGVHSGLRETPNLGRWGGSFNITVSPERRGSTLKKDDVKDELYWQIAGHHNVPFNTNDDKDTIYVVHLPLGVKVDFTDGLSSTFPAPTAGLCIPDNAGNRVCGYHDVATDAWGASMHFAVIADPTTAGCEPCAGGGSLLDKATVVASHEITEVITNPDVPAIAERGWGDVPSRSEIGDLCVPGASAPGAGVSPAVFTGASQVFHVQREWSNAAGQCISSPNDFVLRTSTTNIDLQRGLTNTIKLSALFLAGDPRSVELSVGALPSWLHAAFVSPGGGTSALASVQEVVDPSFPATPTLGASAATLILTTDPTAPSMAPGSSIPIVITGRSSAFPVSAANVMRTLTLSVKTSSQVEWIPHGNFDQGLTGWTASGNVQSTQFGLSGGLTVPGATLLPASNGTSESTLDVSIPIPATLQTANLSFQYASNVPNSADFFDFEIRRPWQPAPACHYDVGSGGIVCSQTVGPQWAVTSLPILPPFLPYWVTGAGVGGCPSTLLFPAAPSTGAFGEGYCYYHHESTPHVAGVTTGKRFSKEVGVITTSLVTNSGTQTNVVPTWRDDLVTLRFRLHAPAGRANTWLKVWDVHFVTQ
jgi:hypothetical protein